LEVVEGKIKNKTLGYKQCLAEVCLAVYIGISQQVSSAYHCDLQENHLRKYMEDLKVYESHIESIVRHLEAEVDGYLAQRRGIMMQLSRGFSRLHALQEAMDNKKYHRNRLMIEEARLREEANNVSARGCKIQYDFRIISLYNRRVNQRIKILHNVSGNLQKLCETEKRGFDPRVKDLESLRMACFNTMQKAEQLKSIKRRILVNARFKASNLRQKIQKSALRVQSVDLNKGWAHEASMKQWSNLGDTLWELCLLQWTRLAPLLGYPKVSDICDYFYESSTEGKYRLYSQQDLVLLRETLQILQALQYIMQQHAQFMGQAATSIVEKEQCILDLTEAQSRLDEECASLRRLCSEYDTSMMRAKRLASSLVGSR
jgi:division protein CdvB (Snf7/Vps24/ESCRT-III family)